MAIEVNRGSALLNTTESRFDGVNHFKGEDRRALVAFSTSRGLPGVSALGAGAS